MYKNLSKQQYMDNFAVNLERERDRLGYSQEEMSKRLDISLSAYKRIINGETQKVDIYICYLGYKLSNKFLFEMVDYSDKYCDVFKKIHGLNDRQIRVIDELIDTFLEGNNAD